MLSEVEILSGILSIIYVAISTYVGLRIASKYFELKQRVFLLVGLTWIGLASPWWPSMVSFLIAVSTGGDGLYNTPKIYFLIGNLLIPIFVLLWITAITDLLYKNKQKVILTIFTIYCISFEVIFLYLLSTDSTRIGELKGPVDVDYTYIILGFLLSIILIILITGILFGRESLKSDNPEVRLKGKLIIIAIILFSIGALLDSAIPLMLITLPITRIILILSAILFYGGFILPNWMKKLFLKEGS